MYAASVVIASLYALVGIAAYVVSNEIRYSERVRVNAPREVVFEAILSQEELMAWSAWPEATGSDCRVEGEDGIVGTKLVYLTNGKPAGSQTVTDVAENGSVTLELEDPSPFGQKPTVKFLVEEGDGTEVTLQFVNVVRRPFHLVVKGVGIAAWTRELHRKDLQGLKAYAEKQATPQPQG
ncbi:MAG: SRPBCC family protein [Planctomycetota bacterium]